MHKHLTWTDRLKIEKGLKEGLKPCAIADRLHVHNYPREILGFETSGSLFERYVAEAA